MSTELLNIKTNKEESQPPIIKVIGVGGGGSNAVNYMYNRNVPNVSYLLCNTDRQHLDRCDVPNTIVLGEKITQGLGAGNQPEVAKAAAEESRPNIEEALSDGTKMVFITAGMGGGTGTGAAPVIARIAKDRGILTVGIVTIPFLFEGRVKILQAIKGVEELSKNVDAYLVVKNELLYTVYPDLNIEEAFTKADEVLTNSTRAISEMITLGGLINLDLHDVRTTLANGGPAIITQGFATAKEGIGVAIERALRSPLVNTSDFNKTSRILINFIYHKDHVPKNSEMQELNKMTSGIKNSFNLIYGVSKREELENEIGVTILASGFDKSIFGLDAYADTTDHEQLREQREQEDRMLLSYYPEYDTINSGYASYKTAILSDEEMDDDEFISKILDTPTLLRRESLLKQWRKLRSTPITASGTTHHLTSQSETAADPAGIDLSSPSEPKETSAGNDHDDSFIRFGI